MTALDSPDITVNHPPMRSGRWAAAADEIVLDYSVVGRSGDRRRRSDHARARRARQPTFTVVGTAVNFTDCFYPQCDPGRTWVTTAGLERFGRW